MYARRHGWQRPLHPLQMVGMAVFSFLVASFYCFLGRFLGNRIAEIVVMSVFSSVAFSVMVVFIRCTATDPSAKDIQNQKKRRVRSNSISKAKKLTKLNYGFIMKQMIMRGFRRMERKILKSCIRRKYLLDPRITHENVHLDPLLPFPLPLVTKEDDASVSPDFDVGDKEEDFSFCSLCNFHVKKRSKHCRTCNRCVEGFDHHCRWLNNCVGRKNYITFILLMAASLLWLIIEAAVGIAVIVRVFVNKREMETEIVNRLGNGFSRAPFATVVGLCTAVSMLALFPLGELFFFHMLLIKKGITTYEYVVAMRAMSEVPPGASVDEEMPNVMYSPSGSATTGFSGGSSLSLPYKGAWCTPPRVFVDYQDEVIPHLDPGMVPSTVDPDATESAERGNKIPKRPVKLSAWKLAKLNSNEATRAAARARASSSVLRPIENRHAQDDELSSSGTMSVVSSVSTDANAAAMSKEMGNNDPRLPLSRNSFAPSHGSKDEYETETHSMSSFSSPSHVHEAVSLSPLPQYHTAGNRFAAGASSNAPRPPLNPGMIHSTFDEKIMQKGNKADPLPHPAPAPAASLLRDVRRTSVVWDQEAGRYVSVPATTSEARTRLASHHQPIPSSHAQNPRSVLPPQDSSSGKAPLHPPPPQQGEKLMYTGDSIFFGGPLVNIPNRDGLRNEGDSGREGQDRMTLALPREARFRRDTTSNQLPVFAPVGTRK